MYTYTATVGPAGLRLLVADMKSPDADSCRNRHGLSIHLCTAELSIATSFQNKGEIINQNLKNDISDQAETTFDSTFYKKCI